MITLLCRLDVGDREAVDKSNLEWRPRAVLGEGGFATVDRSTNQEPAPKQARPVCPGRAWHPIAPDTSGKCTVAERWGKWMKKKKKKEKSRSPGFRSRIPADTDAEMPP